MNSPMADTSVSNRPLCRLSVSSRRVARRRPAARDSSAISAMRSPKSATFTVRSFRRVVTSLICRCACRARGRGIPRGPCGALQLCLPLRARCVQSARRWSFLFFSSVTHRQAVWSWLLGATSPSLEQKGAAGPPPGISGSSLDWKMLALGRRSKAPASPPQFPLTGAARRRKLRGLSAMLGGERLSLGWGVGSLRVSRR